MLIFVFCEDINVLLEIEFSERIDERVAFSVRKKHEIDIIFL